MSYLSLVITQKNTIYLVKTFDILNFSFVLKLIGIPRPEIDNNDYEKLASNIHIIAVRLFITY